MSVKRQSAAITIDRLRPDSRGHDLSVKVLEASQLPTRPGRSARIAECLVGDETGTILLTARNDQVDLCSPGTYLQIQNAKVDMLRTSMRLAVDQAGKLEQAENMNMVPNEDNNMSLLEFELVNVPAAAQNAATEKDAALPLANGH